MDYILKTTNLTKVYRSGIALDNVTISIPKGAIYGLIGNNGAGKTTLMRLLLGLQKPTCGQIEISQGTRTGAMPESPAVYPYRSAVYNLNYQLSLTASPQHSADELLGLVGLQRSAKPVCTYSLGMRQRLGLALALANSPELLILDEPLNGLDPVGIRQIRALLGRLNKEQNMTVVISSHILDELQKLVTHICFLRNGTLVCECPTDEIHDKSLEQFYFDEYEVNGNE